MQLHPVSSVYGANRRSYTHGGQAFLTFIDLTLRGHYAASGPFPLVPVQARASWSSSRAATAPTTHSGQEFALTSTTATDSSKLRTGTGTHTGDAGRSADENSSLPTSSNAAASAGPSPIGLNASTPTPPAASTSTAPSADADADAHVAPRGTASSGSRALPRTSASSRSRSRGARSGARSGGRSSAIATAASSGERGDVHAARSQVANAVAELQDALQEELHEEHLQIYSILGRGGFGTVYHGARPVLPALGCLATRSCQTREIGLLPTGHGGQVPAQGQPCIALLIWCRKLARPGGRHQNGAVPERPRRQPDGGRCERGGDREQPRAQQHRRDVLARDHQDRARKDVERAHRLQVLPHPGALVYCSAAPMPARQDFVGALPIAVCPEPHALPCITWLCGSAAHHRSQEFCNGGSLRQALQRGYFSARKMAGRWAPLTGVLRGIAEGMAYVHSKRICHGDLNPANILLKARHLRCHLFQCSANVPCSHLAAYTMPSAVSARFDELLIVW
jgi:Protein kinase domain